MPMGKHALSPIVQGAKARITALHQHDDSLYAGCADGTLRVYSLTGDGNGNPELKATHPLSRRAIDQVGILRESGQLVVVSDTVITLHKIDQLGVKGSTTNLSQARYAHAFAITSYVGTATSAKGKDSQADKAGATPSKVARDLLVVGCRKKVVVYGAGKTFSEAWELALPHSPRTVIFPSPIYADLPQAVHLLYTPNSSVILHLQSDAPSAQRLTVEEHLSSGYPPIRGGASAEAAPVPVAVGGAFSGLGYIMGKGAVVPIGTRTVGGEVLLLRDGLGVFYSSEGNFTRDESLKWPAPPDNMAFSNPYIYSTLPPIPTAPASTLPTIDVHLAPTLAHRTTITFPAPSAGSLTLLSLGVSPNTGRGVGAQHRGRVLLVSTPTDKGLIQSEGSTIWEISEPSMGEQVDELVKEGRVADAIGLVEATGESGLEPRQQLAQLRILLALTQFAKGDYATAIQAFIDHNVHPAKVVALYPRTAISGNLAVTRDGWMSLFGAVEGARLEPEQTAASSPQQEESAATRILKNTQLVLGRKRSSDTLSSLARNAPPGSQRGSASPEPDSEAGSPVAEETLPRPAVDELIYYLSERRQQLQGAVSALKDPLPSESDFAPLSEVPAAEIHSLPNGPMSEATPEQLLRTAQVIYTSLLKVYLVARPTLVGSLCRIENWCDVAECEPLLRAKGRIDDLRDLYMQKSMHDKAINMLLEQAKEEEDPLDRYQPTLRYLQKLGPKHLNLIFESVKWIFEEDAERALTVFTADEPEVDALPRDKVVAFLEKANWKSAIRYIEHTIELGETGPDMHDKLAELYLRLVRESSSQEAREVALKTLLDYLNSSTYYRPYRLLNKLGSDEVYEARAVLLGRMGNHDEALKIYIYKLKDYTSAEAYCARVYAQKPDPHGIFLHLLRLYLRPEPSEDVLVQPALDLVGRHGTRIDATEVVDLLPPLVPIKDVHDFFLRTLREGQARRNEHRVMRGLLGARKGQVERMLMGLEVKRVRVTDQRICPQCQKRLGTSAIAVHAPHGEVTHLHCKDQFSAWLRQTRA